MRRKTNSLYNHLREIPKGKSINNGLYSPIVIIAAGYRKTPVKEQAMIRAARNHSVPYLPQLWMYETYHDEVITHVGDTIYVIYGQPYTIPTEFICTHPNDKRMRLIAATIYIR